MFSRRNVLALGAGAFASLSLPSTLNKAWAQDSEQSQTTNGNIREFQNGETLQQLLDTSGTNGSVPIFTYFHDPSCPTCNAFRPYIEWKAKKEDMTLVIIDIKKFPEADDIRIRSTGMTGVPHVTAFRDGCFYFTYPTTGGILGGTQGASEDDKYLLMESFLYSDLVAFINAMKSEDLVCKHGQTSQLHQALTLA